MEKPLKMFERYVVIALLVMMMIVVFLGTVELAVIIVQQMLEPPSPVLLNIEKMLTIFGFFLMILIGLELMETIKVYLLERVVHAEIILLVAIIAIARKVIILDVKSLPALSLVGVAAIVLSLSAGYYMIRRALSGKD